jgi:hypothetical protein
MGLQHVENLLRRYRGQTVRIRTMFGGSYQGVVAEITSDYVRLGNNGNTEPSDQTFVLLQSIEAVQTTVENVHLIPARA